MCIRDRLRKAEDLEQDFDGLVLPGGESTVQSRLLKELSMFETLKKKIEECLPAVSYTHLKNSRSTSFL